MTISNQAEVDGPMCQQRVEVGIRVQGECEQLRKRLHSLACRQDPPLCELVTLGYH